MKITNKFAKTLNKKLTTKGAALVEYGILVGLVAVVSIGAVVSLGEEVEQTFSTTSATLASHLTFNDAPAATPPTVLPVEVANFAMTSATDPASMMGPSFGYLNGRSIDQNNTYGSISGDVDTPMGILRGLNYEQGRGVTDVTFDQSSTGYFALAGTLDCGSAGTLDLSDPDVSASGSDYTAARWIGNPLSIADGTVLNCTIIQ